MTKQRRIIVSFAAMYIAMLVFLLFFREPAFSDETYWGQLKHHINPIPFRTIKLYLRSLERSSHPRLIRLAHINLLGNIILFVPLGLFPPLLWNGMRRLWKTALLAAGVMAAIELLQMLLLVGTCDVDDLILNVLGAALGYGLFRLSHYKNEKPAAPL